MTDYPSQSAGFTSGANPGRPTPNQAHQAGYTNPYLQQMQYPPKHPTHNPDDIVVLRRPRAPQFIEPTPNRADNQRQVRAFALQENIKPSKTKRKKVKSYLGQLVAVGLAFGLLGAIGVGAFWDRQFVNLMQNMGYRWETAKAASLISPEPNPNPTLPESGVSAGQNPAYGNWAQEAFGVMTDPEQDPDLDGLNNFQEYLLGLNPTKDRSCPNLEDLEILLKFLDAQTCKKINVADAKQTDIYLRIWKDVEMPKRLLPLLADSIKTELESQTSSQTNISREQSAISPEVLKQAEDYILEYRSYSAYNRDLPLPVTPRVYVEIALEYQIPPDTLLSTAKEQSAFGSLQIKASGQPNPQFTRKDLMGLSRWGNLGEFQSYEDNIRIYAQLHRHFANSGLSLEDFLNTP